MSVEQPTAAPDTSHPLSPGQQRLWFLHRLDPADAAYHIPFFLRLRGPLDAAALRGALTAVVERHEVLRARFPEVDGRPTQEIGPADAFTVADVDLTATPVAERDAVATARAEEFARVPFDLATGPLARGLLLRFADDDHALVLVVHHIAFDAWSVGVLFGELADGYRARVEGRVPELPALPAQYADFARWQDERLRAGVVERDVAHWREHLAGAPALLTLPLDRPRPRVAGTEGAHVDVRLSDELLAGIGALGRSCQATQFMVLLAAFQTLLARHAGQDDVVVGTPIAARNDPRWQGLVGFFVNTIPLRVSIADDPTFRELVLRVKDATLRGLAHAETPFERVVEALQPERSLGHAPVFQAQMILHNIRRTAAELAGIEVTGAPVASGAAQFDVTLTAPAGRHAGLVVLDYASALFDHATMARFARQYEALLTAVAADPDLRVKQIPLLDDAEADTVLRDWNDTYLQLPAVSCPSQLVRGEPDAVAVRSAGGSGPAALTYAELDARAAEITAVVSAALAATDPVATVDHVDTGRTGADRADADRARPAADVGPLVGLCLARGTDLVAAMLGVWRAGAGYVPLDPSWPVDRLRLMIADSGVRVVVTQRAVRSRLAELLDGVATVVCLDDLGELPTAAPARRATGDSPAYVIYTSGSTGRPKGVVVPRRAVVNLLVGFSELLELDEDDVLAAVTTLSFDISVLELLLPLLTGGEVLVVTEDEVGDGPALARRLDAGRATVMQATPATWRVLLAAGPVPPRVRTRLVGGEAFGRDLAGALSDTGTVWNVYGPTETTVWSAAGPVPPGDGPVLLGPPIANTQLYVLDGALRPVPPGVVGDLWIGGAGLATGYLGQPDLTEERFVPDPFAGGSRAARLYRTGDLARYSASGAIEFIGRVDHQVKIRGFRIELGEIEAALAAQDAVREAVVVVRDDRLVAYVTPADGAATTAELAAAVRPGLAAALPEYMVPSAYVLLDAMPLTPNNKTDRAALPAPVWGDHGDDHEHVEPDGAAQRLVAGVWLDLLAVPRVGAHDDFFRLGGHSLLGAELLARLRDLFGVEIPVRALFEAPTVAGLTAALVAAEPVPGHVDAVAELRAQIDAMSPDEVAALLMQ